MPSKSEKTKEKCREALVRLLQRHPFDEITVSELAQAAGISRTAFYSNYKKTEDVLTDFLLYSLAETFGEKFSDENYVYGKTVIYDFINYFDRYGQLLSVISQWNLLDFLTIRTAKTVDKTIKSYYEDDYIQKYVSYFQYYNFAGLYYTLLMWVQKGKKESKEQMYDILTHFYDKKEKWHI